MACLVHLGDAMVTMHLLLKSNRMEYNPPMETFDTRVKTAEQANAGFTLLEIIAVIVIMSILAVVAVPRYFDLQTQARDRAMATGVAEGIGRVNGYFAQQILNGITPNQIAYTDATLGTDLGDFSMTTTGGAVGGGSLITIMITGDTGTPLAGMTRSVTVRRPGGL